MAVRKLRVKVADCQTRSLPLPGATGLAAAETQMSVAGGLSPECLKRLSGIYGSRATHIITLAKSDAGLAEKIDSIETVLAAEVVFALRHEMAVSLIDIVHRRLMTGLLPDQGASMNDRIATIAAAEAGWDSKEQELQLTALQEYNERLRPPSN
jgi:glycerol-3-phosphate dehydrogenase